MLRVEKWLRNEESHNKLFQMDFLTPKSMTPFTSYPVMSYQERKVKKEKQSNKQKVFKYSSVLLK